MRLSQFEKQAPRTNEPSFSYISIYISCRTAWIWLSVKMFLISVFKRNPDQIKLHTNDESWNVIMMAVSLWNYSSKQKISFKIISVYKKINKKKNQP